MFHKCSHSASVFADSIKQNTKERYVVFIVYFIKVKTETNKENTNRDNNFSYEVQSMIQEI